MVRIIIFTESFTAEVMCHFLGRLPAHPGRCLRRRRHQPHIVRGYFGDLHVRDVMDRNPMSA
ncbi:hypothetical protein ACIPRL_29830 [Streptomyces sp. NPDC090085]|uniref:hypothetical protein n=1 Tax=Streptomyces sp. NPDC090085 TaxID=3365943 RepID=UPI003829F6EB